MQVMPHWTLVLSVPNLKATPSPPLESVNTMNLCAPMLPRAVFDPARSLSPAPRAGCQAKLRLAVGHMLRQVRASNFKHLAVCRRGRQTVH